MPAGIAITRAVSAALADCELTHLERVPIDVERARAQHRAYEEALREAGYLVERLESTTEMPDSVFVEDIAIVFDELAIITRPGAESRRAGDAGGGRGAGRVSPAARDSAARHRRWRRRPRRRQHGRSSAARSRTNEAAVGADARRCSSRSATRSREAVVRGCLHLKSAVTALGDDLLLVNPDWIDPRRVRAGSRSSRSIRPSRRRRTRCGSTIASCFRHRFRARPSASRARGCGCTPVDASEVAKAEGAVTCCSLIVAGRISI